MNENKKKLEARSGYGRNIEHIAKRFSFEIAGTQSIFNIALAKQKDIIIPDTRGKNIHQLIPQWFRHRFNTPSFVFLPITYEETCIGAFYADREKSAPPSFGRTIQVPEHASQPVASGHQVSQLRPPGFANLCFGKTAGS